MSQDVSNKFLTPLGIGAILLSLYHGPTVSIETVNRAYFYTARLPVMIVITYPILVAINGYLMTDRRSYIGNGYAGIGSQAVAFFIDFTLNLVMASAPLAALSLVLEFIDTGVWQWNVERSEQKWFDHHIGVLIFLSLLIFTLAFALPTYFDKQSFGQNVMGIKLFHERKLGIMDAVFRVLLGTLAMFLWPFSLYWAAKDEKKRIWHNKSFGTFFRYIEAVKENNK